MFHTKSNVIGVEPINEESLPLHVVKGVDGVSNMNGNEAELNAVDVSAQMRQNSVAKMRFAFPEILAMLLLFPQGLSSGVFTNLLMESLCMRVANMSEEVCAHVDRIPPEVQSVIQPQVNRLLNWKVLIETFLPAFCVVFLGPWSDKHGRRPLILISILGQFLYYSILTVQVFFKDSLPAEYYLLAAIPVGVTGGLSVFFLSVVCFITDCTTDKNRAFKMGTFQAGCMVGSLIAQLLTAKVSRGPHGFQVTFMISSITCFINLLYAITFIPESVNSSQDVQQVHLLDLFKAFTKKRPRYRRALLYLLMLANTSYIIIVFGESDIFYQSAIKRFQWSLQQFSNLNSISVTVSGSVLVVGTYIFRHFGISDVTAALIVVTPHMFGSFMSFYAPTDHWLYVAAALGCISSLVTPFYRTAVTKIIPSDELGKVFAVIMFTEALVPSISSNIYTFAYNSLIHTQPGAIFLVSVGFAAFSFSMLLIACFLQLHYPSGFEQIVQDQPKICADQSKIE